MNGKTYRRAKLTLKIGGFLHLLVALPFLFCLGAAIAYQDFHAIMCTVAIGFIHALILTFQCIAYCKLYKGKRIYRNSILEKKRARYIGFPYYEVKDYKKELEIVRENYKKDVRKDKNQIPYIDESSFQTLYEYETLRKGKIYYAYLIMANTALFDTNSKYMLAPAVFLYSTDEYYEENPLELGEIAHALYENRENNFLKDEESYEKNVLIDETLTNGRKVYASTILMYRPQLPLGYLSGKVIPVIVNPGANTSTFAIDVEYWSPNLIANFAKADDINARIQYDLKNFSYNRDLKITDYKKELETMQKDYIQFFKNDNRENNLLFEEYALPKVFYSYIVDAKKKFNQPFSKHYDFPAVALYSEDEYYKETPKALKGIAEKLFESEDGRRLVKRIIDYRGHTYNSVMLPTEWCDGREVIITSIFIHRFNLPRYFLNSRIIPIIKFSEENTNLVALPKKFWGEAFVSEFMESKDDIGKEIRDRYHLN